MLGTTALIGNVIWINRSMKYFILAVFFSTSALAVDNSSVYMCRDKHGYIGLQETKTYSAIAACIDSARNAVLQKEHDRLWNFLKKNPHYRYSGVALPAGQKKPLHSCWGKDKKDGTSC